jgi:WD40 repeat protein
MSSRCTRLACSSETVGIDSAENGQLAVVTCFDGTTRVWDLRINKQVKLCKVSNAEDMGTCKVQNSALFIAGDSSIFEFDLRAGSLVDSNYVRCHKFSDTVNDFAVNTNGDLLVPLDDGDVCFLARDLNYTKEVYSQVHSRLGSTWARFSEINGTTSFLTGGLDGETAQYRGLSKSDKYEINQKFQITDFLSQHTQSQQMSVNPPYSICADIQDDTLINGLGEGSVVVLSNVSQKRMRFQLSNRIHDSLVTSVDFAMRDSSRFWSAGSDCFLKLTRIPSAKSDVCVKLLCKPNAIKAVLNEGSVAVTGVSNNVDIYSFM